MNGSILYSAKRMLRILDSRWTPQIRAVRFRGITFKFYSTFWWNDISQQLLETEIAPYFDALAEGFQPAVVIDVGAATGHFAILAATLFPGATVYAFEPSERQRILLKRNAHLNGIPNLKIESFGLWNCVDELAFRTNGAESSFESVSRFRGKLPFLEKVAVKPLDQWISENEISQVNLIKMDAEGAEIEILEGASALLERDHPNLLIQAYHLRDGVRTLERCAEILRRHRYEFRETADQSGLLFAT
jgi:FkbM family methyltransferase